MFKSLKLWWKIFRAPKVPFECIDCGHESIQKVRLSQLKDDLTYGSVRFHCRKCESGISYATPYHDTCKKREEEKERWQQIVAAEREKPTELWGFPGFPEVSKAYGAEMVHRLSPNYEIFWVPDMEGHFCGLWCGEVWDLIRRDDMLLNHLDETHKKLI